MLTALEASALDLYGTRLVVLSACETGLGEELFGEGVYGLRRALVMAGSETQVMSLWQVNDATTRDLMVGYYRRLSAGGGRAEALRAVQRSMLREERTAHPYYWASFIVSGDPSTLEGRPVTPDFAKVSPGARGCGCEIAGDPRRDHGTPRGWLAGTAAALLTAIRKRQRAGCTRGHDR